MVYDPVSCRFSVVLVVEVLVGDDEGGGALLKFLVERGFARSEKKKTNQIKYEACELTMK